MVTMIRLVVEIQHANIANAVLGCLQLLLSNEHVRSSFSNDTTDGTKVLVSLIVDALEHAPQATGKIHHLMLSYDLDKAMKSSPDMVLSKYS